MLGSLFCEHCGGILRVEAREGKCIGLCNCGFTKEVSSEFVSSERMQAQEEKGGGVVREFVSSGFPYTCKKCGHGNCDIFDLGASYSDESNIYLYTCKKCGFVARQADGTGNL